ncbi:AraC family transcriptional regulator [Actinoplanes sp. TBRC 11911]|uniref:AraC family transcriptional regulator n=1 Tax=Actinoplanes sp. TBRC 11911 TaxID=2729386 RepID=UPI00145FCA4F|nr:AraC family transcriptional regulator [Actinoplanes sp. TBRC 11911]NMO53748.1 AraC family transcriptional regulator [Actinoplanes sp. TBRC 11911]
MLDELSAAVARHSAALWTHTAVPRLSLVSVEETASAELLHEPMICFAVEGAKRTTAGDRTWLIRRGDLFLNSLEVPVTASAHQAPFRCVVLRLDATVLAGLLLELDTTELRALPSPDGQVAAPITPELADAVTRWVRLLDTPADIGPLASGIETEILYRLLNGPVAPVLRQFAIADSSLSRIRAAARWIRENYDQPLSIETIAATAHMSVATLHRQFKAATGMSPIRFQKQLRLQEARRLLLARAGSAAQVATVVGYASPSQFNREYRRAFGLPPAQDASRLRQRVTTA